MLAQFLVCVQVRGAPREGQGNPEGHEEARLTPKPVKTRGGQERARGGQADPKINENGSKTIPRSPLVRKVS